MDQQLSQDLMPGTEPESIAHKFDPGGNKTILVDNRDGKIMRSVYGTLAQSLMVDEIEQVGFIETGEKRPIRLQMMGGEFCINAARCAALWNKNATGDNEFEFESSGTDSVVSTTVAEWASIEINMDAERWDISDYSVVGFDGITHFVLFGAQLSQDDIRRRLDTILEDPKYEVGDCPAVGLIIVDQRRTILPLIYVRDTNTFIFETACGSGTIAALIAEDKMMEVYRQPSGSLYVVERTPNGFNLSGQISNLENFKLGL